MTMSGWLAGLLVSSAADIDSAVCIIAGVSSVLAQIELDAQTVRVVEPDVFFLAVGVDFYSAVSDFETLQLQLNCFEFREGADTEGKVVQANLFFVVRSGLAFDRRGEEKESIA